MKNLSAGFYLKVCFCVVFLLSVAGCARENERSGTAVPSIAKDVAGVTTDLATMADSEEMRTASHLMFSESGRGVAYFARKGDKIYVVHNGKAGKCYPITIGEAVLSADGRHVAYGAIVDGNKWGMVVDAKEGKAFDSVMNPLFSRDGQHLVYQAKNGDTWHLIVDDVADDGTKTSYNKPIFSADSRLIAYVENDVNNRAAKLIVSDLRFRKQRKKGSAGEWLVANKDRTRLAATQVTDNKLRVIDFSFAEPDVVHEGRPYDKIDHLTFGGDGVSVSYVAVKDGRRLLVLDDREEPLPDADMPELPVIRPDKKVVGILLSSPKGFFLHQAFSSAAEKEKLYEEAANLVYSSDSLFFAYVARRGKNWFAVVNGKEGPLFDRVVTPVFSPDGKRLVYRARKDGKRFLVISDTNGKTVEQYRAYEQVFQPVFTADGKSVAYGVKDGNKLIWKVEKLEK